MKKSQKQTLAVGAGVAALAAAATGVYFMTGKHAKNRKIVAKWVGNLQKDVIKELGSAKDATQAAYNKAVDTAVRSYKGMKNINALELAAAAAEMKSHWNAIRSEMAGAAQTVRRITPKSRPSKARVVKVRTAKKTMAKKSSVKKATKKRR